MKREAHGITNRNLSWLCREHYNGLMVVCTIRRAVRHSITNSVVNRYIQQEFFAHLDQHFREEEAWLFPKLPATNALRIQTERQHEKLRRMVSDTELLPEDFANLLEEHIRFEERTLFPVFAK